MAATGFVTYAGSGTSITLNDATTKVAFVTGAGAAASEAYATVSYDTSTGQLSFDADGTGSTASAIVVATLFSDFGDTAITDLLAADLSFIA
jgi:Ca2+-binding RTX toxin-like protein